MATTAPDFEADTTEGRIKFHDWIGDSWAVLFSHPKDFTPVCTTELGYMANAKPEFDARNMKIIGLSVDALDNHEAWAKDIEETQGTAPNYPIISDADFNVSKLYGMLPASTSGDPLARTPADNQTVRNVFVIGPDKKVKLILVYPMTTGRNFDEVLRVIDSLQLTAKHKVATPVNWKKGEKVIIAGSVSNDEAKETYPEGWEEPRPYIRLVTAAGLAALGERGRVAGAIRAQPLEEILDDARGRAPDEVLLDDVRVGLERDPAPFHAVRVRPARSVSSGSSSTASTSSADGRQSTAGRDRADERVDHVVRRERRRSRQRAEQAHIRAGQADLLLRLAQRGHAQVGVARVAASAGKGDLARVAAQVRAAPGENHDGLGRAPSSNSGTSTAASIGPAARALPGARVGPVAAPAGSGGHVDALNALLEHDLAVEHAVDRALRRDHAAGARPDPPEGHREPHHELELRRAAALGGRVLDRDLDVADVPALARRIHLHRDRRARCEADREQLLRIRARVVAADHRGLVDRQLVVANRNRVLVRGALASCGGFHACKARSLAHLDPFITRSCLCS